MIHSALNCLVAISKTWSISEALWVLQVYHCEKELICWQNFWTSANSIETIANTSCAASQVHIKFYGGPKGNQECRSSLSIFTVDRVLRCWQQNKIGWAWLLQFNCDTVAHVRDQLGRIKPDTQQKELFSLSFEDERVGHWESFDSETIVCP